MTAAEKLGENHDAFICLALIKPMSNLVRCTGQWLDAHRYGS